jgi:DNA-binding CsgD family transcriptional regulator/Flp pilus assembly protein TadD
LCTKQGVVGLDALFSALRAVILTITGGADDTLAQAVVAVDELRRTKRAELKDALRMLGYIHRARGELDDARHAYDEAAELGERGRPVGLALVALAEGRNAEAAAILEAALESVPPSQPLVARQLLPYAVEALIAVDRTEDAERFIESTPQLSDPHAGAAQLLHALGLLRFAQGRNEEARTELTLATHAWDEVGNRLECRRARVALLEALFANGNETEALALGRQLLDELGNPLLPRGRELVRRVLRRAGVRTPPAKTTVNGQHLEKPVLTTREQAVLEEVANGRTNREIAEALGIAEKTVSVHVSHILAKLECKTRTQAARFVSHNETQIPHGP